MEGKDPEAVILGKIKNKFPYLMTIMHKKMQSLVLWLSIQFKGFLNYNCST
jgi:hypothetical protein